MISAFTVQVSSARRPAHAACPRGTGRPEKVVVSCFVCSFLVENVSTEKRPCSDLSLWHAASSSQKLMRHDYCSLFPRDLTFRGACFHFPAETPTGKPVKRWREPRTEQQGGGIRRGAVRARGPPVGYFARSRQAGLRRPCCRRR